MRNKQILLPSLSGMSISVGQLQKLCHQAGEEILKVYRGNDHGVRFKEDGSPVTRADFASHDVIVKALEQLTPNLPVISEEEVEAPFSERSSWERYWLVDPLDGTREFVNGTDEFTINIALIEKHKAIFGMVYVPVSKTFYFGGSAPGGAWLQEDNKAAVSISTRPCAANGILMVTVSRHVSEKHMPELFERLHRQFADVHLVEWAGAIKGCLVADGSVDFYPRPGRTWEWDTAAFQAIVEAAGGKVIDGDGNPMEYNKRKSLLNPDFYVLGDPAANWLKWLELG